MLRKTQVEKQKISDTLDVELIANCLRTLCSIAEMLTECKWWAGICFHFWQLASSWICARVSTSNTVLVLLSIFRPIYSCLVRTLDGGSVFDDEADIFKYLSIHLSDYSDRYSLDFRLQWFKQISSCVSTIEKCIHNTHCIWYRMEIG